MVRLGQAATHEYFDHSLLFFLGLNLGGAAIAFFNLKRRSGSRDATRLCIGAYSHINSLDSNPLIPRVLQHPTHLLGTLMTHHGRHQIQTRIQPARHPATRNDPQPPQLQSRPPRIALPPLHALLPRITPLPRDALAPSIRPLRQHERILIQIGAQVEARVVDHVVLLHDVRLLEQLPAARRFLAQDLEFRVVVRVRGRGHALQ